MQVIPGSHRCGRLDHSKHADQAQADLERVEHYKQKLGKFCTYLEFLIFSAQSERSPAFRCLCLCHFKSMFIWEYKNQTKLLPSESKPKLIF